MTKSLANVSLHQIGRSEPVHYRVVIEKSNPSLSDLLFMIAETEWGKPLFTLISGALQLRPGYFLVVNGVAVQLWEANATPISNDVRLKIVPFVAGG